MQKFLFFLISAQQANAYVIKVFSVASSLVIFVTPNCLLRQTDEHTIFAFQISNTIFAFYSFIVILDKHLYSLLSRRVSVFFLRCHDGLCQVKSNYKSFLTPNCLFHQTIIMLRHHMLLWFVKIDERNLKKLQFTTQRFDTPV